MECILPMRYQVRHAELAERGSFEASFVVSTDDGFETVGR